MEALLKLLREKAADYTYGEVMEATGLSAGAVANVLSEGKQYAPSIKVVCDVFDALGYDVIAVPYEKVRSA